MEGLGAVAGLEKEGPASRHLGQGPAQGPGLAGEDERREGGKDLEGLLEGVVVRPIRLLLGGPRPPRRGSPFVHALNRTGAPGESKSITLLSTWRRAIGIFGGTFDPIHVGHLVAAVNTRHDLGLDRVIMMVANVPWQKAGERQVTPAEDRFEMVEAAVDGVAGLEASRAEIDRGGPSYTADTVSQFAASYPGAELFVIVGWDVGADLGSWERLDEVRDLASLVVVNRPGTPPPAGLRRQGWRLVQVTVPNLEISSTDLRARAADRQAAGLSRPRPGSARDQGT